MFNKKALFFALSLAAMGLASCGGGGKNADLYYWCPSNDTDVMAELAEKFIQANPEYAGKSIQLGGNYEEGGTAKQLHADLDAAADVMLMADDNIRAAVQAEELAEITDADFAKTVDANAVQACSVNGKTYGYAYRADNSPMPFYATDFYSAADVTSLETILQKAKASNKKIYFDLGNGWYNACLLWAGDGDFKASSDGQKVITNVGGKKGTAKAGVAAGLKAFKELYNTYKDNWVVSSTAGNIEAGFKSGEVVYAFCWNDMKNIKAAHSAVSVAPWPSINIAGAAKKLETFQSFKAVVCKYNDSDPERLTLAKKFAAFLANKDSQQTRLEKLEYGPSNKELLASDKVAALPFIKAINEMNKENRLHGQAVNTVPAFWDPMATLGGVITNGKADGTSGAWGESESAERLLDALVSNSGWEVGEIN